MLHDVGLYGCLPKAMDYSLEQHLLVLFTYYSGKDTALTISRMPNGGYELRGYSGLADNNSVLDITYTITDTMIEAFRSQNAILAGWIDALSIIHNEESKDV